jgi:hypothetical protein
LAAILHLAELLSRKKSAGESDENLLALLPNSLLYRLGLDGADLLNSLPSLADASMGLEDLLA